MSQSGAKKRILVSDKVTNEGIEILKSGGEFEVDYKPEITPEDLVKEISKYNALVIRSRTTVTKDAIAAATNLEVIGRAGVGVDNVDVESATKRGIVVMNTPDGNTLSTAEHSVSMLCALARRIPYADHTMKAGKWEKKGITGVELYDKTLGVFGMGRIGREVAKRAQAFGMKVLGFDPFFSKDAAEKIGIKMFDTVDEVVERADFLTVHTPMNSETRGMIGAKQIEKAKKGVLIVNCARGGIVDEAALVEGLKSGKVGGAALDVFETEPLASENPFRQFDNVVLTPHLGAATAEAQDKVCRDVALQIVDALRGTVIRSAVNAPSIDPELLKQIRPCLILGESLGKFVSQILKSSPKSLEIVYSGSVCQYPQDPITTAIVKGFLEPHVSETVNYVNAGLRARERGLEIRESRTSAPSDFTTMITLRVKCEDGSTSEVSGTLFASERPKILRVNGIDTEVNPVGRVLMIENEDKPGTLGAAMSLLGKHNVNIAEMNLGRQGPGGRAFAFLQIDSAPEEKVLDELRKLPNIHSAKVIVC